MQSYSTNICIKELTMHQDFIDLYTCYKNIKKNPYWSYTFKYGPLLKLKEIFDTNSDKFEACIIDSTSQDLDLLVICSILEHTNTPAFQTFRASYNAITTKQPITFIYQPYIKSLMSLRQRGWLTTDTYTTLNNVPNDPSFQYVAGIDRALTSLILKAPLCPTQFVNLILKHYEYSETIVSFIYENLIVPSPLNTHWVTDEYHEWLYSRLDFLFNQTSAANFTTFHASLFHNIISILAKCTDNINKIKLFMENVSYIQIEDILKALDYLANQRNKKLNIEELDLFFLRKTDYESVATMLEIYIEHPEIGNNNIRKILSHTQFQFFNNACKIFFKKLFISHTEFARQFIIDENIDFILNQPNVLQIISKLDDLLEHNLIPNEALSEQHLLLLNCPLSIGDLLILKKCDALNNENLLLSINTQETTNISNCLFALQYNNLLSAEAFSMCKVSFDIADLLIPLSCIKNKIITIEELAELCKLEDVTARSKFIIICQTLSLSSHFTKEAQHLIYKSSTLLVQTILDKVVVCAGDDFKYLIKQLSDNTLDDASRIQNINQCFKLLTQKQGTPHITDPVYQLITRKLEPTRSNDISIGDPIWFGFGHLNQENGTPVLPEFSKLYRQWQLVKTQEKSYILFPKEMDDALAQCNASNNRNEDYCRIITAANNVKFQAFCKTYNLFNPYKFDFLEQTNIKMFAHAPYDDEIFNKLQTLPESSKLDFILATEILFKTQKDLITQVRKIGSSSASQVCINYELNYFYSYIKKMQEYKTDSFVLTANILTSLREMSAIMSHNRASQVASCILANWHVLGSRLIQHPRALACIDAIRNCNNLNIPDATTEAEIIIEILADVDSFNHRYHKIEIADHRLSMFHDNYKQAVVKLQYVSSQALVDDEDEEEEEEEEEELQIAI